MGKTLVKICDNTYCSIVVVLHKKEVSCQVIGGCTFRVHKGQEFIKNTESIQISNVSGAWFIFYNSSGTLVAAQTDWDLSTTIPIAAIYWNGTNGSVS